MLQRLIAAVLGVLGVAAIGLGVASATAWRADDPLVATAAPGGDTRTLVTDPGVLELAGDPVTVTVRADGSPVVLAVGRDTDVTAWVGSDPYERVTGLSDWHTLATTAGQDAAESSPSPSATATEEAAAEAAPSPSASEEAGAAAATAADPTGSDMWVVEVAGDGSATLEWPAQEGRWSLLAVSLGDSAPVLDLSWPQTVTTPWLWPGVALGVLLLAVAAILLVRILRERREGPDAGWTDVSTGTLATVPLPGAGGAAGAPATTGDGTPAGVVPLGTVTPGAPPTRRQLREAEAAAAAARRRGGRTPTGAVPVVTGATPAVTGATPVVTGATPVVDEARTPAAGAPADHSARAGAPDRERDSAARPAGGAPGTPATTGATPAPGARDDATTALPAVPGAPGTAPASPVTETPAADERTAGRRLADRLPWRRGRASHDDPGADATGTAATGTAATGAAGSAPGSAPAGAGSASPAATAWSPVPGSTPATRPAAGPAASTPPAAPAAPTPRPAAAPGAATPGVPPAGPAARPGAAPRGTGASGEEDDAATRAQRADAWRRMWGFPSADEGGTPAQQDDDTRGTEEGR
ncbi:hypothetical protein [Cellulomonas sp.]|uniref:hypothetical protein n=1 Tax=Cellulomonas sp. TaxID=40001 RepID=UPI002D43D9D7|nr:hypothetical protein [Cellulomonas sp.]HYQ74953.1 hypothetical protein [Cellulomonas sp.]